MGLFRKDFFRSLLVGFVIGTVGMGVTMMSEARTLALAATSSPAAARAAAPMAPTMSSVALASASR
ncbi:hypothetical protein [Novosphingobium pituita]|uniref:Uncharacterized protein n=1 Tax=Novosphingobium pituita TaxID=3056842 RepID=A0ABQ6P7N0_9SPHN|nr:hypothetical protein [Novosphingobium sp. IK01]MDK4805900.1 hypothetical protein [Novosphingobium aromaticivorans]GMM61232.1 hypothetical protein NUTIK01_20090 [Novosphingobium sp. IK01]HIQ18677.1 hypothetical protein [Novosphingobium capsulatum]